MARERRRRGPKARLADQRRHRLAHLLVELFAARAHARQATACNLSTQFDTIVVELPERFDATRERAAAVGLDVQFSPAVDRRSDPAVLSRIAPLLPFLRSNDSCKFNFADEIAKKIAMWNARQRAYARAASYSRVRIRAPRARLHRARGARQRAPAAAHRRRYRKQASGAHAARGPLRGLVTSPPSLARRR